MSYATVNDDLTITYSGEAPEFNGTILREQIAVHRAILAERIKRAESTQAFLDQMQTIVDEVEQLELMVRVGFEMESQRTHNPDSLVKYKLIRTMPVNDIPSPFPFRFDVFEYELVKELD